MGSLGEGQHKAFFVTLISLLQLACLSSGENFTPKNYSFPDDFMFGVGTSAFQIEGAWNEDGKGESIWDTFVHKHPEVVDGGATGDVIADSYHHYMDDIEAIKSLGVDFYRMSISWPRILPNGTDNNINQKGVKYYRTLFEELLKTNITPLVTLFHWDMPTPLSDLGGWTNSKVIDYYEDYARIVFKLYGDLVKLWVTINEPYQQCIQAYGNDVFAPAMNSHGVGEYLCVHYMLLGHARVYRLYEKEFKPHQKGKVGISLDADWGEPKDPNKPEDVQARETYLQMHLGFFAHPIFSDTGDYPSIVRERIDNMSREQGYSRSRLPYFTPEEIKALEGSSDFFGINHYTSNLISPSSMESDWKIPSFAHDGGVKAEWNQDWPLLGGDWISVFPAGLRKLLNWIQNRYRMLKEVPIIITENGLTDRGETEDYDRIDFYNNYLYQVLIAIHEDKVNVKGYSAWALIDVFEWIGGLASTFGLFKVDFDNPNKTRTPKLSAKNYANIVRTHRIDFNYMKRPSL